MKRILTILFLVINCAGVKAQAPTKLSYQAVVRDANNALVSNAPLGMRITILQGSPTGTVVYQETQTPGTNDNGLATLAIGDGVVLTGNINTINWANGPYFIKTETDPSGGTNYTISGTSQLMSVPFALYAETSGNAGPQGPPGNDGLTVSVNNVQQVNGNITLSKSDIGLDQVDNTADADKPVSDATQDALNLKANIASPSFTGTPTVPTAAPGTSTAQIATTSFVATAVTNGATPDADASTKGKIALGGDLGGAGSTAETPIISANAISTVKIADLNVTTAKIADDNITTAKIADGNVTTSKIADDNVTTAKIADNNITTTKIADANVTTAKLADASITTTKIADNNVTEAKLVDGSVTTAKIADDNITTAKIADGSVTAAKLANNIIGTTSLVDGSVTSVKIADNNVTTVKLADGSVTTAKIADNNVTEAKLVDGSVTTAKIADDNVTTAKIADNNVTEAKLVDGSVTTTKIADDNITTAKIADGNVTTVKIANGAVTTAKITDASVTTTKLADASVTTDKIADDNITTAKIADDQVTTAKITDANVTYAKIQDVSTNNRVLGRVTAGNGPIEEIATTGSGDVVRAGSPALTGTPTAPTASTNDNSTQIATTAFTKQAIAASEIKDTPSGLGLTISDAEAGKIITTQWSGSPSFPENLSNGFTCTIVNYSNSPYTSNTLSTAYFFTEALGWNGGVGLTSFGIKSGGTVKVTVVDVNGVKGYFVTGDIN